MLCIKSDRDGKKKGDKIGMGLGTQSQYGVKPHGQHCTSPILSHIVCRADHNFSTVGLGLVIG